MSRVGLAPALALLCALAAPAAAQAPKSIDPGMSEAKVVERLGAADASRSAGDFKYLFYHNNCIKQCGMDDVVILQKDSVVDAMFRSSDRAYSGKSSSPRAIPAEVASRTRPGARDVPSGEVVQAGNPRPDTTAKHEATAEAKHDSATEPAPSVKQPKRKPVSKTNAAADSMHHDTVTGTLRIPVKPPVMSAKHADSLRADTVAKRPPHED
jgi:hypothetical protein